jgi:hypothetical protein
VGVGLALFGAQDAGIAALRGNKAFASNNLAGAIWEQSISIEMTAVAAKNKAMNDIDAERAKQLRIDLAEARMEFARR